MTWVVLAAALAQDARQDYARAIYRMNRFFWEERLSVAKWAKEAGLHREARGLLEFMRRRIDGYHPYKTRAGVLLRGTWKDKPNRATPEKLREYSRRLRAYYRGAADRCFEAYRVAKTGGMAAEAKLCLGKTVEFYYDHEAARRERGEERVEGFGWLPAAEARRVRDRTVRFAEESLDHLEKEDARHATWGTAWIVRSPHYLLRTDLPIRKAAAALDVLERLYAAFREWAGETIPAPKGILGICFFRRAADLDRERLRLPGTPLAVSFYHAMTKLVYVRSFDSAREKGVGVGRSDREFLLHEATHQLLDLGTEETSFSIYQEANKGADAKENFWIVEGIATYFSTLHLVLGKSVIGNSPWRMSLVRLRAKEGTLPTLGDFLAMDAAAFLKDPVTHYSTAYAFTRFLLGRDKKGVLSFLKEFYLGRGSGAVFRKIFGPPDGLQPAFTEFLTR